MAKYRKKPVEVEAFQYDGDLKVRTGGVNGELDPCKPDIFLKTYEEVV